MVFNGEIYNSTELKKKFNLKNIVGTSDTEILLEFIEKYGVEKIKYIRGMNSVIIYDLQNKKILGAGLDVFENEPTPNMKVLMAHQISLSPHIGAATLEAQDRIGTELAEQIEQLLK